MGVLIAVNCGVFLYQLLRPDFNETLLELYGLSSQGVEQGALVAADYTRVLAWEHLASAF